MSRVIGTLLARLWGKTDTLALASKKNTYRPAVEGLEERAVPAVALPKPVTGSISGHVFVDTTGNGAASLGGGQRNVQVNLYADTNNNGVLDRRDQLVDTDQTNAAGAYSFNRLAADTYFVRERVPSNYVRTMPDVERGYTVNLARGQNVTDQDFANFHRLNRQSVSRVSFTVTNASGTHTFTDLAGNTKAGDVVTANFTVARGASVALSLVAYTTSGPVKGAAGPATAPSLSQVATQTFGPGKHSLAITLPNNFYQVDFVLGAPISQLNPAAASHMNYEAQDRLLSQDNGGQAPPVATTPASLSGTVFLDDGDFAFSTGDTGVDGAMVALVGTDVDGNAVNLSFMTSSDGVYSFTDVAPGTYTVSVSVFGFSNLQTTAPPDQATQTQALFNVGEIDNVHVASGGVYTGFDFLESADNSGNAGS